MKCLSTTLSDAEASYPTLFGDNIEADPLFVDAPGLDFTPDGGSPLIDAGRFITSAVSAGSGTALQVDDAGYFVDGFGIDGERGDRVQLDGQTDTARILAVDYDTNTLTLDTALTWDSGTGVTLAYEGSAPDICIIEVP